MEGGRRGGGTPERSSPHSFPQHSLVPEVDLVVILAGVVRLVGHLHLELAEYKHLVLLDHVEVAVGLGAPEGGLDLAALRGNKRG